MTHRADQDELDNARAIAAQIQPAMKQWSPYETHLALQILIARDFTAIGLSPAEAVAMLSTNMPKFMEFWNKALLEGGPGLQ